MDSACVRGLGVLLGDCFWRICVLRRSPAPAIAEARCYDPPFYDVLALAAVEPLDRGRSPAPVAGALAASGSDAAFRTVIDGARAAAHPAGHGHDGGRPPGVRRRAARARRFLAVCAFGLV